MTYLSALGLGLPKYRYEQADLAKVAWRMQNQNDELAERKLRFLYRQTRIQHRYSVLPDYSPEGTRSRLFPAGGNFEPTPGIEERMRIYQQSAFPLAEKAIHNCLQHANDNAKEAVSLQDLTHLITVSCTGLSAPGLELEIKEKLELADQVQLHTVNFMGCYAAFHGMKLAHAFCQANPRARVLLVSVELCTLHTQKGMDESNLLANALFADGAAAALITGKKAARNFQQKIRLRSFVSRHHFSGKNEMAWGIGSTGFLMKLSSYVPSLVNEGIRPLLSACLEGVSSKEKTIDHWAIHPGGSRILEASAQALELDKDAMPASWEVLKKYGNMSSATILFVLKELWERQINWEKPERIFAAGFGPGLTLESAVMEVVTEKVKASRPNPQLHHSVSS